MRESSVEIWAKNLQLINKASIFIIWLQTSDQKITDLCELSRDKLSQLKIDSLDFSKETNIEISNLALKVINDISPNSLLINNSNWSFEDLRTFFSLNLKNINIEFEIYWDYSISLIFSNSPILLFNFDSKQKIHLIWESVDLDIQKEGYEKIVSLKINANDCINSHFLFVPFVSVGNLNISGFKTISISSSSKFELEFENLISKSPSHTWGFLFPLEHLNRTLFNNDDQFFDLLKTNYDVSKRILSARYLNWTIKFLDDLLEIKESFPDLVSHINYSLSNWSRSTFLRSITTDIINGIILIDPKFKVISFNGILSPQEFKLIWSLLDSNKIKFNIWSIQLGFNLLSEWLTVLSLLSNCTELESIYFFFSTSDVDNEQESIKTAANQFRSKYRFMKSLKIAKF